MLAILPIRERRCQDIDQVSSTSWDDFFFLSQCPFGVNCRLQLAGLGKKREETVKPTCFSLLYETYESDFGTTHKSFTVFFARWGVKLDRRLKIAARWGVKFDRRLKIAARWVRCAVEAKEKLAIIMFCGFWFPCLNAIWYDLDVTLRDDSSFGKLTNSCN